MWQAPQAMPTRNGGSTEPSQSRFSRLSGLAGSGESAAAYPCQPPILSQAAASNRGFGNFLRPSAPVEVPKRRSQLLWRWSTAPCGVVASKGASWKSHAGSR